jgi:hypothetical protein
MIAQNFRELAKAANLANLTCLISIHEKKCVLKFRCKQLFRLPALITSRSDYLSFEYQAAS